MKASMADFFWSDDASGFLMMEVKALSADTLCCLEPRTIEDGEGVVLVSGGEDIDVASLLTDDDRVSVGAELDDVASMMVDVVMAAEEEVDDASVAT